MHHDLHLQTAHLAVHEGVGDVTPVEARTASRWPQDALKEMSYTHPLLVSVYSFQIHLTYSNVRTEKSLS